MQQIVITKISDTTYKVTIMGNGRTEEMYKFPTADLLKDNLYLMLNKLVAVHD